MAWHATLIVRCFPSLSPATTHHWCGKPARLLCYPYGVCLIRELVTRLNHETIQQRSCVTIPAADGNAFSAHGVNKEKTLSLLGVVGYRSQWRFPPEMSPSCLVSVLLRRFPRRQITLRSALCFSDSVSAFSRFGTTASRSNGSKRRFVQVPQTFNKV